jgi:hypothetical protein
MTASEMAKLRWSKIPAEKRRKQSRKAGKARMRGMTARQRRELARLAANARWKEKTPENGQPETISTA